MKITTTILLTGCICFFASAQVKVDNVKPQQVAVKGFSLETASKVDIRGAGGVFRDNYQLLVYYGWILNTETREVVWHLFDAFREKAFDDEDGMYDFRFNADLPAGNYELYFTGAYSHKNWHGGNWTIQSFGDLLEEIFDSRDKVKFRSSLIDDLHIAVEAPSLHEVDSELLMDKVLSDAAIYYTKARDDERFKDGFTINKETKIRIYALGEGRKDEIFDYLWIYDASGKRVFEMSYHNTSFAGGAEKNLKVDEEIILPAGSYIVNYVTDNSHSYEEWNDLPPDDPQFWGVTIFAASESEKSNFVPFDPPKTIEPVVQIKGNRDHELATAGFKVKREMDVRLLCIGEESYHNDLADYGWIVDAETRNTVWKMRRYRTEHAGGAGKNRRAEETITLPEGEYIAYYVTDGSHSYGNWNAARPMEEDYYGLSIFAKNESDLEYLETFNPEEYKPENVLTEIVMVRDNEYYKEYFSLSENTRVTIMAQGEGRDGKMYDFGWIKHLDSGKIVWEMDYGRTEPAGGSGKNRMIREILDLPAGDYRVYYETDGSHSFGGWNASPPSDPQSYGIRIVRQED